MRVHDFSAPVQRAHADTERISGPLYTSTLGCLRISRFRPVQFTDTVQPLRRYRCSSQQRSPVDDQCATRRSQVSATRGVDRPLSLFHHCRSAVLVLVLVLARYLALS